jgi:hypothetical protein
MKRSQFVTLHVLGQLDALGLLLPQTLLDDEEGVGREGDQVSRSPRSAAFMRVPQRRLSGR